MVHFLDCYVASLQRLQKYTINDLTYIEDKKMNDINVLEPSIYNSKSTNQNEKDEKVDHNAEIFAKCGIELPIVRYLARTFKTTSK